MYLTHRERILADLDPSFIDRERAAAAEHARKVRLPDQLDAALRKLEWERQTPADRRKGHLVRALDKVERLTAEAVRLGLIPAERKQAA